jgi:hypothetical protein
MMIVWEACEFLNWLLYLEALELTYRNLSVLLLRNFGKMAKISVLNKKKLKKRGKKR